MSAVKRLNERSGVVDKIRIVHEDSLALMPDGDVILYKELANTRPLLVLNPDELTPEKMKELIDTGIYRRRYADFKLVQRIEKHVLPDLPDYTTFGSIEGKAARKVLFGIPYDHPSSERLVARDSSTLDSDREQILMQFYDERIKRFTDDVEDTLDRCREVHRLGMFHKRTYSGQTIDPVWETMTDETRAKRRTELRKALLELPPPMLAFMERKDVEIADAAPITIKKNDVVVGSVGGFVNMLGNRIVYSGGGSGYIVEGTARAHVNARRRSTLLEEAVHYVDGMCCNPLDSNMWSQRPEWVDAVARESLEAKLKVEQLMGIRDKTAQKESLFDKDGRYSADDEPAEFLANVAQLDHHPPKGFTRGQLAKLLPETYPLYQEFMRSIKGHMLDRVSRERETMDKGYQGQSH